MSCMCADFDVVASWLEQALAMKFSVQWPQGYISDGVYYYYKYPVGGVVLWPFLAHHQIQGQGQEISPQQAQFQLQLLIAMAWW